MVLSTLPALLGYYAVVFRVMIPAGIAYFTLLLGITAWLSLRGDRLAQIFLVAWSVLLVGAGLYYLRVAGVLPYNLIT